MFTFGIACVGFVAIATFGGCLDESSTDDALAPTVDAITSGECTMRWSDVESGAFEEDEVCDAWISQNDGDVQVGPYRDNPDHERTTYQTSVDAAEPCVTDWEHIRNGDAAEDDICTSWVTHDGTVVVGPYWYADELRETDQIGQ